MFNYFVYDRLIKHSKSYRGYNRSMYLSISSQYNNIIGIPKGLIISNRRVNISALLLRVRTSMIISKLGIASAFLVKNGKKPIDLASD